MAWWIIECTSTKEQASCEVLQRLGYEETFYPQKRVNNLPKAKRARAASKAPRYVWRAWVPGYVFACAERITPHIINKTHGRLSLRVLSPGGIPYEVTDEDMARMADVPKRVRDLIEDVKRQEREAWLAKRPEIGKPAVITVGALQGQSGPVTDRREGEVQVEVGPIKAWVREEYAEKVA